MYGTGREQIPVEMTRRRTMTEKDPKSLSSLFGGEKEVRVGGRTLLVHTPLFSSPPHNIDHDGSRHNKIEALQQATIWAVTRTISRDSLRTITMSNATC
jgi:hypothetical protein